MSLFILVFLVYIYAYYLANSGYYEYHMRENMILTNEKIKEFEEDVKNNEDIDIKDYLEYEPKDYSNKATTVMYEISDKGVKIARRWLKAFFRKISYLIED